MLLPVCGTNRTAPSARRISGGAPAPSSKEPRMESDMTTAPQPGLPVDDERPTIASAARRALQRSGAWTGIAVAAVGGWFSSARCSAAGR
jgi:hypothetical protein